MSSKKILPINPEYKMNERELFIFDDDKTREEVVIPTVSENYFLYDGEEKQLTFSSLDTEKINVINDKQTQTGNYNAELSLVGDSYKWSDGGIWTQKIPWTICGLDNNIKLSDTSMLLKNDAPSKTINIDYIYGSISVSTENTSLINVSNTDTTITASLKSGISKGSTNITVTIDGGIAYETRTIKIPVYIGSAPIYGVFWDGTDTWHFIRTDDSSDMDEAHASISGSHGNSPFDNLYPWSEMKEINDQSGFLISIPKFYYKWTLEGDTVQLQISPIEFDGSHISPAHMDRGDGNGERSIIYISKYQCAKNTYKSLPGYAPASTTRATHRTNIRKLGTDIYMIDMTIYWTIRMLYLVEYANWNYFVESLGLINYSVYEGAMTNGDTDNIPYHTGIIHSLTSTVSYFFIDRYRNIENPFQNDIIDGQYYYNGYNIYILINPSKYSNSRSGGTLVGQFGAYNSAAYIKNFKKSDNFDWFIIPNVYSSNRDYVGSSLHKPGSSTSYLQYFSPCWDNSTGIFSYSYMTTSSEGNARFMKLPN